MTLLQEVPLSYTQALGLGSPHYLPPIEQVPLLLFLSLCHLSLLTTYPSSLLFPTFFSTTFTALKVKINRPLIFLTSLCSDLIC